MLDKAEEAGKATDPSPLCIYCASLPNANTTEVLNFNITTRTLCSPFKYNHCTSIQIQLYA